MPSETPEPTQYIPAPTLPVTTVPPIPWRSWRPLKFHPTTNRLAESALPEDDEPPTQKFGEPIIPDTLAAPCEPPPEPPKP
jgi:hypothetical protein